MAYGCTPAGALFTLPGARNLFRQNAAWGWLYARLASMRLFSPDLADNLWWRRALCDEAFHCAALKGFTPPRCRRFCGGQSTFDQHDSTALKTRPQKKQNKSLESLNFTRFQPVHECGSGPGGWRFKSSLPDHSFQALTPLFCFRPLNCGSIAPFDVPALANYERM